MKRLFTLIAAAMVFVGGYAQTYKEFAETTVLLTTKANLTEEVANNWVVDNGTTAKTGKKATIDPETDATISAKEKEGIIIKGSTKSVTFYVKSVSEVVAYAINASGSETRILKVTATPSGENAVSQTLKQSKSSTGRLPMKLESSKSYKLTIEAFKEDGITAQEMILYAMKFIPATSSETVTIGNAGFATYYSANAVDYSSVEGLTAYAVKYADNKLVYTPITGVAKANTPVLLQGEAKEYTLTASTDEAKDVDTDLKAATSAVIGASNIYALANKNNLVAFYQVSDQTSVPAGKCYLEIPASENGASAKAFFALDTETTGIFNVDANCKTLENGVAYSLSGQRVGDSYKGIVIINGKKVIRK